MLLNLLLAAAPLGGTTVLLTEVVDATLPSGLPKFVEVTNVSASPVDLSQYSIGNFNNGGITLGGGASTLLTGTLQPGESYVYAFEADPGVPNTSLFATTYGFEPDQYAGGGFVNGDDVIALYFGVATGAGTDAVLVDVYGEIGFDGTGQVWEYTDSYAYRCGTTSNFGNFDAADWVIPGANTLEGSCGGDDTCELANILAETTPGTNPGCAPVDNTGSAYCFGDGSNGDCPCGNNGAAGEGCQNSAGTSALLVASGNAEIANDTFTLSVSGALPGAFCLFVQGDNQLVTPLGNGFRCVQVDKRGPVALTDASGAASRSGLGADVTVGQTRNYQVIYRDTADACGGGFNYSNGWTVAWN